MLNYYVVHCLLLVHHMKARMLLISDLVWVSLIPKYKNINHDDTSSAKPILMFINICLNLVTNCSSFISHFMLSFSDQSFYSIMVDGLHMSQQDGIRSQVLRFDLVDGKLFYLSSKLKVHNLMAFIMILGTTPNYI